MAAKILRGTCAAKNSLKIYTNESANDVVATLNIVSQSATVNPKINVAISNNRTAQLNFTENKWTTVVNTGSPVSLDLEAQGSGGAYWGMNTTSGTYGLLSQVDGTNLNVSYEAANMSSAMQFVDPYYFLSPSSYDDTGYAAPFAAVDSYNSGTFNYHKDFRGQLIAGSNGAFAQSASSGDYSRSHSYYDRGATFDPYTNTCVSINQNSYMTCSYAYPTGFSGNNQTTNSLMYNKFSTGWTSNYNATSSDLFPWTPTICVDNGLYVINGMNGGDIMFFKLYANATDNNYPPFADRAAQFSSSNFSGSSNYWNISPSSGYDFRWMKWHPVAQKFYFYIGKNATYGGLYSFSNFQPTTSVAGHNANPSQVAAWTLETTNLPADKMTRPARIGASLWVSYTDEAVAYFTQDFITWKTLSEIDTLSSHVSNSTIFNDDASGNRYYGNSVTNDVQFFNTGFGGLDKGGYLEFNTQVGNFERSGIVVPKGESIYVENTDGTADVSVSLMTVDI